MKPSLRLAKTLLAAPMRAKLGPYDEAVTHWRVRPGDVDLYGHMNNSRYLAVMDLARVDFLVRVGLSSHVLKHRWTAPIGGASLEFRTALRPFEAYEIRTQLLGWDQAWFYLRQEFRRSRDNAVVGTGYVKTLFRNRGGIVGPPEVVRSVWKQRLPSPRLPDEIKSRLGSATTGADPSSASEVYRPGERERDPIAVVGMGCRLPGGVSSPDDLWSILVDAKDCIVEIPASRWDAGKFYHSDDQRPGRSYVHQAGLLEDDLESFDAGFFGITPREAEALDPQQRLLLETSWEALEDGGIPPHSLAGTSTGVFVGGFTVDNMLMVASPDNRHRLSTHSSTAGTLTMLSNRLSYFYDLRGPSMSVDTACSSSLVALHSACRSLWSGESSMALVGGASALMVPEIHIMMSKGKFLSPSGRCQAFSENADGYVRAEGATVLALKPLSAALRDGNPVRAVIRGSAVNQDGRTAGITTPNEEAQVAVLRAAYADAGVNPRDVCYVEAHGTGTQAGDPVEARAIGKVVGAGRQEPCLIGSVKTNMGHLEAASGVTGVAKAVLCLQNQSVPPNLHFEKPNPAIPFDELGIRVSSSTQPLVEAATGRIVGVNSFGYGGSNAHVVLGELSAKERNMGQANLNSQARPAVPERPLLLPLSGQSPSALPELCERYAERLQDQGTAASDVCRSAGMYRSHHRHRLCLVASSRDELIASLGQSDQDPALVTSEPKILFVYTGMGPQWWGMGRQLMKTEPVFRDAVLECDAVYRAISGQSIAEEMQRDEATSRMHQTEVAQPANVVLQIALTRLWSTMGVQPDGVVGHSVGEIASAFAAGALSLHGAMLVAYHRSRLQQTLAGRGTMLAAALSAAEVDERRTRWGDSVAVAAYNSPGSVTLSGDRVGLEAVARELESEGRFHRFLKVEVPYHSHHMDDIEAPIGKTLARLQPSAETLPILSTVTGSSIAGTAMDGGYFFRNLREPVRFQDAIDEAATQGYNIFVEVGPHPVLAASIRDSLSARNTKAPLVASLKRGSDESTSMAQGLADLYCAGVAVDWKSYFGGGSYTPVPTYPWQRRKLWEQSQREVQRKSPRSEHPLFSDRESGPSAAWVVDLNQTDAAYFSDHVVGGVAIFPGAGFLELVLAARQAQTGDPCCSIEDIEFTAPVALDPRQHSELVVELPADAGHFTISERRAKNDASTCAKGKVFSAGRPQPVPGLAALRAKLSEQTDIDGLYEGLQRIGLSYGPAFRAARSLSRGDQEILVELELDDNLDATGYWLHPVLLDAAMHSLLAGASVPPGCTIVPESIKRLQLLAPVGRRAFAYGRLSPDSDQRVHGDLTLFNENGAVLAELQGLSCRVLPARQRHATELDGLFVERSFVPLAEAPAPALGYSWIAFVSREGLDQDGFDGVTRVADNASLVRALTEVQGAGPSCVIDLRFAFASDETSAAVVDVAAEAALELVETLRSLEGPGLARYCVVTQKADVVSEADNPSLSQAAVLGTARTAMSERPELCVSTIDVDAVFVPTLLQTIAVLGPEQEVALRDGQLYAARLQAATLEPQPEASHALTSRDADNHECCFQTAGDLSTVGFQACERRPPGVGEIEIEVEIGALAFKDVMKALGGFSGKVTRDTYFGETIGMEGVGRVVAVGPGVEELKLGDRVYAVAPAFLRAFVTLSATHALALPDSVPSTDVLNLVNFMTAYYGLVEVARLQPSETVLIHGASGGVGLAAIEVARWLGAEVIATAGTEKKRRYLRELGIERVAHSRDVRFADDVREWTDGRGVDVVLNYSSGEIMVKSLGCVAPFGRFVEIGKLSFEKDEALHLGPFNEGLQFAAIDMDRMLAKRPEFVMSMLGKALEHLRRGDFRATPAAITPARGASEAFRSMARAEHVGKIGIAIAGHEVAVTAKPRPRFRGDATYLVTGGLRGFGLQVARWLANEGARHLLLVSRSGNTKDADECIAELEAVGVRVTTMAVDVGSSTAVETMIEGAGDVAPLAGVFHAATVYDDHLLADMDRGAFERVMSAKASGAWNLHLATDALALDHFVLFSSVSALIGNAGQANYVAANTFLDQLARFRRRQDKPALSVHWGSISDAGAVSRDTRLADHLQRMGLTAIASRDALACLARALDADREVVAVVDANWSVIAQGTEASAGAQRYALMADAAIRPTAEGAWLQKTEESPELLIEELQAIACGIMRLTPQELDPDVPLNQSGMDSLIALEISAAIEAQLGLRVPSMLIAGGPSLRTLSTSLLDRARGATPLSAAS